MNIKKLYLYVTSPLSWRYERRRGSLPLGIRKITDRMFRVYELWRVSRSVTRVMGFRFSRSRTFIEIDLTYNCTLQCAGCNRSIDKAPSDKRVEIDDIKNFIKASIQKGHRWKGIRVLGGEPTLHSDFSAIIELLRGYKKSHLPTLRITVVTNGNTDHTRSLLEQLPGDIFVENTAKKQGVQYDFAPFNKAPKDNPNNKNSDYRNGCWITEGLGMGLTPYGYYHCAIAGNIDRIYNFGLARDKIPDNDDPMYEEMSTLCALCGHFFISENNDPSQEVISKSWRDAYASWQGQCGKGIS
ncbi:radical SAM protein [Candidatus Omnitrophota bacterium]